MITMDDLTDDIKYFGAKIGDEFRLIGYVDIKHGENLVFHANLTQRTMSEVAVELQKEDSTVTAEDIQGLAQNEANSILSNEETTKVINDYITLFNLGLYGQ